MRQALLEAQKAYDEDEIPVGVVVVCKNQIIARAYNQTERLNDVTAHAEIMAITAASAFLGAKYLEGCEIFTTLEPCVMCAGASYWTQISRIVYGAKEEKRGFTKINQNLLHPKTLLKGGILSDECGSLMSTFFANKRKQS